MSTVYLEIPESVSGGVYVTAAEVYDVIHSSHIHCCWEVRRDGELQPCGKEAVAIRFDENNGRLGEVCKHHAKRVLVPLTFIAEVAATSREPVQYTRVNARVDPTTGLYRTSANAHPETEPDHAE